MKKNTVLLSEIVFFGSIWGILEASLGYVLHFLPVLLSGTVMFAVASFLLTRAYQRTESRKVLFGVGVLTALIKAFDFFLPAHPVYGYVKVINPMFCIVLESVVLAFVIPVLLKKNAAISWTVLPIASILWRAVFIFYLIFQDTVFGTVSSQLSSFASGSQFVLLQGLISGGVSLVFYGINRFIDFKSPKIAYVKPLFSSLALVLAIVLTILI